MTDSWGHKQGKIRRGFVNVSTICEISSEVQGGLRIEFYRFGSNDRLSHMGHSLSASSDSRSLEFDSRKHERQRRWRFIVLKTNLAGRMGGKFVTMQP